MNISEDPVIQGHLDLINLRFNRSLYQIPMFEHIFHDEFEGNGSVKRKGKCSNGRAL
jgi:hypothetical protein